MMWSGAGLGLGFGWGFGGLMAALGCALVVVGLVLLVAWAISGATGSAGTVTPATPAMDPVETLRHRLARGEITVDEFTLARQALETGR